MEGENFEEIRGKFLTWNQTPSFFLFKVKPIPWMPDQDAKSLSPWETSLKILVTNTHFSTRWLQLWTLKSIVILYKF